MVKKRTFICFIFIALILTMSPNVFAAFEKVYDEANLLTEEERAEINDIAIQLSDQTELDVIIVTMDDSEGKSSAQYAQDFYEEHGFGYQGTLDGILFLLNMDEREVYIFTRDLAYDYISDARVEEILDQVYPALAEERYSESIQIFLAEVERFVETGLSPEAAMDRSGEAGGNAHYGNVPESSPFERIGIYLLIAVVIGGIAVGVMAMGNQGRSTTNARTYLENNSFTVTKKIDRHYNTIVTRQKIQKNTGAGGGGRSGGGRIGGGGRKF